MMTNFQKQQVYYLELGLYSSIMDIVEAKIALIQERNNHRETCITIKVSRVTQKIKVYLANKSSPAILVLNWDIYLEEM